LKLTSLSSAESQTLDIHRTTHPSAGSLSYRHNATYTAVRDIIPGEELTVYCNDDSFDGGAYFLSTYRPNDDTLMCLDKNVRIATSTIPGAGKGLFVKRRLSKGSNLLSTPLIPIHRKDLEILNDRNNQNTKKPNVESINTKQLLLNYCLGHQESDLLLLPYGPMFLHINHDSISPNAVLRWHTVVVTDVNSRRRQQYHHPELWDWTADEVADAHGMGLMVDLVSLRNLEPNEEVRIDYGIDWSKAWEEHVETHKEQQQQRRIMKSDVIKQNKESYIPAAAIKDIRTKYEQEINPYPNDTVRIWCIYDRSVLDDHVDQKTVTWNDDNDEENVDEILSTAGCLAPCDVISRLGTKYTIRLDPQHNDDVGIESCQVTNEVWISHVPEGAIRILDRPYTADMFLVSAFRHEIGVPDGFYPDTWMRKKLRRTKYQRVEVGDEFKRKQRDS
jgi:hypothetical protein